MPHTNALLCTRDVVALQVGGLVNFSVPKHLYRARKKDFLTWAAAFFITLFAGVLPGIGTAVGLSTLFFIYHSTAVQVTELARVRCTALFRLLA
jgi:MFS superfamily sulfate permease-like transporter